MSLYSRTNPLQHGVQAFEALSLSLSFCFIHFPMALSLSDNCNSKRRLNFHDGIKREAHLQCNRVRVQSVVHWIWVDVIPGWPGHSFTHLSRFWIIFRSAVRHCFSISRKLILIAFSAKLISINHNCIIVIYYVHLLRKFVVILIIIIIINHFLLLLLLRVSAFQC